MENDQRIDELVKRIKEKISGHCLMLEELGRLAEELCETIETVGELLRYSQPVGAGKLVIRWWKKNGEKTVNGKTYGTESEPVLARWQMASNGRYRAVELKKPPRKIREDGVWKINAGETRDLIDIYLEAKKDLDAIREYIAEATSMRGIGKTGEHLVKKTRGKPLAMKARLEDIRIRIRTHLRENGYLGDL